jgi:hypothetical protein
VNEEYFLTRNIVGSVGSLSTGGGLSDVIWQYTGGGSTTTGGGLTTRTSLILLSSPLSSCIPVSPRPSSLFWLPSCTSFSSKFSSGNAFSSISTEYDKEYYKDKDCFQCGKKGHPKAACTVKMVPADEEKSTKQASSTKSASSKAVSKEVDKMLSLINNSFKTMGKAFSQVHEEIGTLAHDEDFKEQSHAQIGMVMCGRQTYSFATGKFSMRNHLLLDNQSLVHVFCNPQFVSNVRSAERKLKLTSNGGNLPILEVADFDRFNKEVWYSEDTIINILSLSLVKHKYSISYDGEDFIIHRAKHGYADMVFKPHPSGLHVYDPDDPQGHASYSFVKTVEETMAMFTKCQIVNAKLACKLQAGMVYPSIPDLKWIVQSNQIKDCPVTAQDVNVALKILGPSGNIQGGHKFYSLNTGVVVV